MVVSPNFFLLFLIAPQRYEVHSSNMSSQDSYREEAAPTGTTCRPESQEKNSVYQLKKGSNYYNKTDTFPRQNSPLNVYEESGGLTFSSSSKRDHKMNPSYNFPRSRSDSVSNNHGSYSSKIVSEPTEMQLHNHGSVASRSFYRSGYLDYNPKKMPKVCTSYLFIVCSRIIFPQGSTLIFFIFLILLCLFRKCSAEKKRL